MDDRERPVVELKRQPTYLTKRQEAYNRGLTEPERARMNYLKQAVAMLVKVRNQVLLPEQLEREVCEVIDQASFLVDLDDMCTKNCVLIATDQELTHSSTLNFLRLEMFQQRGGALLYTKDFGYERASFSSKQSALLDLKEQEAKLMRRYKVKKDSHRIEALMDAKEEARTAIFRDLKL